MSSAATWPLASTAALHRWPLPLHAARGCSRCSTGERQGKVLDRACLAWGTWLLRGVVRERRLGEEGELVVQLLGIFTWLGWSWCPCRRRWRLRRDSWCKRPWSSPTLPRPRVADDGSREGEGGHPSTAAAGGGCNYVMVLPALDHGCGVAVGEVGSLVVLPRGGR